MDNDVTELACSFKFGSTNKCLRHVLISSMISQILL